MEPPAKRRRRSKSPPAGAASDDDDDDELCFEPVEVSAKRDAGYRLSLQRAYADSRFQATMAHIFEKYGRDFDGIGDEIDMVSGNIVVDNGHLQNMRDEADVGIGEQWSDDEDQGISLDQLLDVEDDDEGYLLPRTAGKLDSSARDDEAHDDEDDIMSGRQSALQSQSLVPVPKIPPSPGPSLLDGVCGTSRLDFGASFAFGASPLAFGASPLAGPPWSLTRGFSASAWAPPSLPTRAPRLLPLPGERYNFPAQDSGSSIWAPGYRFKEDDKDPPPAQLESGSMRPRPKTRTRPMKTVCPRAPPADQEVDEDAILTGKSSSHHQIPEPEDDQLEQLSVRQETSTTTAGGARRKPSKPKEASRNGSKKARHKLLETPETSVKTSHDASMPKPQRRNGDSAMATEKRVGKDAEPTDTFRCTRKTSAQLHMGETPQSAPRKQIPSRQRIAVELSPLNGSRRDEYEEVDIAVEEVADSAGEELGSASCSQQADGIETGETAQAEAPGGAVSLSGVGHPTQVVSDDPQQGPRHDQKGPGRSQQPISSLFCLSDDEMPIWSRPRRQPRAVEGKKLMAPMTSPAKPVSPNVGSPNSPRSSSPCPGLLSARPRRPKRAQAAVSHDLSVVAPSCLAAADGDASMTAPREDKSRRLTRELRWLCKLNGPDAVAMHASSSPTAGDGRSSRRPRHAARVRVEAHEPLSLPRDGDDEIRDRPSSAEPPVQDRVQQTNDTPPSSGEAASPAAPRPSPPAPRSSPSAPAASQSQEDAPVASPPQPTTSKPETPRHRSAKLIKAPCSRRSILSLLSSDPDPDDSDNDADADQADLDELGRGPVTAPSAPFFSSAASRKIWKSSARTTEVYHTPVKRRPTDVLSPGSIIKTPGGTLRTCGLAGYRCGRDFCFSCL